jgi:hypothetical protein
LENLESETVKCGHENLRMAALAKTSRNCKRQTHPFIREDYDSKKKILVVSSRGFLTKKN